MFLAGYFLGITLAVHKLNIYILAVFFLSLGLFVLLCVKGYWKLELYVPLTDQLFRDFFRICVSGWHAELYDGQKIICI